MEKMKYLIFILLIFGSCKSVKKNVTKTNETIEESVNQEIKEVVKERIENSKGAEEKKESKSVEVSGLKIFPRGEFTIDNFGTFKGQADSVVQLKKKAVKEVISKKDTVTQVKTIEADRTIKNNSERLITKELKGKQVERKPSLVPWIGFGLFIGLIAGLIYFYLRKVK
jgi:organic radical activating enzyme